MDRKFGSNLLESRLDVDSATSAHRLQDSFADPRKGNARASSMNGKSIHGNPSDHRTAAVDVSNTAKVAGEVESLRCRHCDFWKLVKISKEAGVIANFSNGVQTKSIAVARTRRS